ncbi:MAG TPA: hypothetical protein VK509_11550, partial [Polyangiales bacterium]|nr:hypothetical protein [Polyangiales bacterium]
TDQSVADLVRLTTVYGPDADRHTVDQADAPFAARVAPIRWTSEFDVYLIFHCGPEAGGVGYQVQVRLDTSEPAASGDVSHEIIPYPFAAPDAG